MRIATWNVNSIKARLAHVTDWLGAARPDILLMQELKCERQAFPEEAFSELGYNAAILGQKTYNGVAILSRAPIEDVVEGLPGDPTDEQARYLEARIGPMRVASLYLPNGNPAPGPKYDYKLNWMRRLRSYAQTLLESEETVIMGGDYNICPTDDDVYDPAGWADDALVRPESRAAWRALLAQGWTEALGALRPGAGGYTFWDYQGGAWAKDNGLRIDHFLCSPQAADRISDCIVDRAPRGREKASDHTPVILTLDL